MFVTFEDIAGRMAVPPEEEVRQRVELLISDAESVISTEFLKCGRSLDAELDLVPWLNAEFQRVVREMVTAAITIGPNAGVRSVSSTTGQESDSVTYANGIDFVSFGGVKLTEAQRTALGLCAPGGPRGTFPPPIRWPERRLHG